MEHQCKYCRFWDKDVNHTVSDNFRDHGMPYRLCYRFSTTEPNWDSTYGSWVVGAMAIHFKGESGEFVTWPEFGCVEFEARTAED